MLAGVAGFETVAMLAGPKIFSSVYTATLHVPHVCIGFLSMAAGPLSSMLVVAVASSKKVKCLIRYASPDSQLSACPAGHRKRSYWPWLVAVATACGCGQ